MNGKAVIHRKNREPEDELFIELKEYDGKGFRQNMRVFCRDPFYFTTQKIKEKKMKQEKKDKVVAYRKSCKATGTGLSHYILIKDKK